MIWMIACCPTERWIERLFGTGGGLLPVVVTMVLSVIPLSELEAQPATRPMPTIAERTAALEMEAGFLPLYRAQAEGRLYLEVPQSGDTLLFMAFVTRGVDPWTPIRRGDPDWWRGTRLVRFEREADRVILIAMDVRHTASGTLNPGLDHSVRGTFGEAPMATLPVEAEEDGRLLVDVTDLALGDQVDASGLLRESQGVPARLDRSRSRIDWNGSRAYEDHTTLDATLTLASDAPQGEMFRERSPDHRSVSFGQRIVFRQLPEGFQARPADLRLGLWQRYVWDFDREARRGYRDFFLDHRWRLEPQDSEARPWEPLRPLTIYLEAGIPQAYRTAVREGVLYWNRALEAAGFWNAIEVDDLPPGADLLDLRYPVVILWEPQAPGVASMGLTATDPRTGEALKGLVRLSSSQPLQRVREYSALRGAFAPGQPDFDAYVTAHMSRLTAHELGHVLGVTHNNASASIVARPGPAFQVNAEGRVTVDLEAIFPSEPHPYDRWLMRYGYTPFATPQAEEAGLEAIVREGLAAGLRMGGDWTVDPGAARGLHGRDPLEALEGARALRRAALEHFGPAALEPGDPVGLLFERLVWPYFFVLEDGIAAVAAMVGGIDGTWVLHGDGQPLPAVVPADRQREALRALADLLAPEELAIPPEVAGLVAPTPPWTFRPFELEFPGAGTGFRPLPARVRLESSPADGVDELDWARTLAESIVRQALDPGRLARVAAHHSRDPSNPSLEEVMNVFLEGTWLALAPPDTARAALRRVAERVVLDQLLTLTDGDGVRPEVQAVALARLKSLREDLAGRDVTGQGDEIGHVLLARRAIDRLLSEAPVGR